MSAIIDTLTEFSEVMWILGLVVMVSGYALFKLSPEEDDT